MSATGKGEHRGGRRALQLKLRLFARFLNGADSLRSVSYCAWRRLNGPFCQTEYILSCLLIIANELLHKMSKNVFRQVNIRLKQYHTLAEKSKNKSVTNGYNLTTKEREPAKNGSLIIILFLSKKQVQSPLYSGFVPAFTIISDKNRYCQYLPSGVSQPYKYGNMQNYSGNINNPEVHVLGFVAEHLHPQKTAYCAACQG